MKCGDYCSPPVELDFDQLLAEGLKEERLKRKKGLRLILGSGEGKNIRKQSPTLTLV